MQAINALARLQTERDTVARVVGAKSPNTNWAALLALSNYYSDEKDAERAAKTLETSKGGFKSGNDQDKAFAVLALGELARRLDPNSKTRANILKFLQGKDVVDSKKNNYVRAAGAVALGVAGDRTAIPLIADLLDDTTASDYVVGAACVGLGLLRATPQADTIRETVLLKTKWDADARGYGALAIALMGDTTRLPQLQEFERTKLNDKTRRQVTLALALLGDKKDVRAMTKFFSKSWKRNERYEISNAAYGLAWIRDQSVLEDLVKMTKSPDEQVRGMAAIALGYTAARDRVTPLAAAYENQSYRNFFGGWTILDEISKIL
jgi:HEAT repeat protein